MSESDPTDGLPLYLKLDGISVDLERGVISGGPVDGARLGEAELRCLRYLVKRPHQEISRDMLRQAVWHLDAQSLSRAPDYALHRLRQKLEKDPKNPLYFLSVRGVGYRFVPPIDEVASPSVAPVLAPEVRWIALGALKVDLARQRMRKGDGPIEDLSTLEARILKVLIEADGKVVTHNALAQKVWGLRYEQGARRRMATIIWRLRQKIENQGGDPSRLMTLRGQGYRLILDHHRLATAKAGQLPDYGDDFIGRGAEAKTLGKLLAGPRLISLVGPGGVGKTRLAIHVARAWQESQTDREVRFCDLSAILGVEGLMRMVVDLLELNLPPHIDAKTRQRAIISAFQSQRSLLLLLDNFEQIQSIARRVVGEWVRAGARILLTSRITLNLPEEKIYPLPALQPDEARHLFMSRATAPIPIADAALDTLIQRLDYLPLALELAAAQTQILSPEEIALRLDEGLLLIKSQEDNASRHQSLRSSFRWSWRLLTPGHRMALQDLATFAGDFTLEGAQAVWGVGVNEAQRRVLLLVQRSLLQTRQRAGHSLYKMLFTVRALVLKECGDMHGSKIRHANYITQKVSAINGRLECYGRQGDWQALRFLLDECEEAWHFTIHNDPECAARLLLGSIRALATQGGAHTALERIKTTLSMLPSASLNLRLELHYHLLRLMPAMGQLDEARVYAESTSAALRNLPLSPLRVRLKLALGLWSQMEWELERGFAYCQDAAADAQSLGNDCYLSNALSLAAMFAQQLSQDAQIVLKLSQAAVAAAQRSENCVARGVALHNLAYETMGRGNLRQAIRFSQASYEALSLGWDMSTRSVALALHGVLLWLTGFAEDGHRFLIEGIDLMTQGGLRADATLWLGYLGMLYLRDERLEEAENALIKSLTAGIDLPGFLVGPTAFLGICDARNGFLIDAHARVQEARALASEKDAAYLDLFLTCILGLIENAAGANPEGVRHAQSEVEGWVWGKMGQVQQAGVWMIIVVDLIRRIPCV